MCGQCSGHFTTVAPFIPVAALITWLYIEGTGADWLGSKAVD